MTAPHVPIDNPFIGADRATTLNRECFCFSLDEAALSRALEAELGSAGLYQLTRERCPHLFSAQPVFVGENHIQRMAAVIAAVETVVNSEAWQARILASAPAIARHNPGARGVFMGYDFHVNQETLGLIEINTNAGGALLNLALARGQRACCDDMTGLAPNIDAIARAEQALISMFHHEWRLAGQSTPLSSIAIVDENPEGQYLYPEFLLIQSLFRRHGLAAVIVGPEQLRFQDNRLWAGDLAIDLVYNRLTDFLLEHPHCAALREAYLADAVVLTPHPRAHALYADKRNLALLTDPDELNALNVAPSVQETLLTGIPRTQRLDPAQAEHFWARRRQLFFKPASGYGSKAAWRGDKITKRVWNEISAGNYVAQALVAPGERLASPQGSGATFKFDLRNYVYDGEVQWLAARLYQGQTTNFRTAGGGFAPVYYRKSSAVSA